MAAMKLLTCMLAVGALAVAAQERLDYQTLVRDLYDLERLPALGDGVRTKQLSSYDRATRYDATTDTYLSWDANADSGKYVRVDLQSGEATLLSLNHSGCIVRLWSANPQGKLRFYLDGARAPLEFDFSRLLGGKEPPFSLLLWARSLALANDRNPAGVCYLPIPFARSCRVTADRTHNQFYAIGYKLFPENVMLPTFRLPLGEEERHAIAAAAAVWAQAGADPQPSSLPSPREWTGELPAGGQAVLELDGPATIHELRARLDSSEPHAGRKLLLRIYWDDAERPGVDCPLGDFFGGGPERKPYRSLPMGVTAEGEGYCFFRMPFRRRARIVVLNEGAQPALLRLRARAVTAAVADAAGYFHARWRRERECSSFDYPILVARGRGKLVGATLTVDSLRRGWWGEGDEKIWVDGEVFPSSYGVSTDGYFNQGGSSLRTAAHALFGAQATRRGAWAYRWHIPDSVSFRQSLRFTIENYAWLQETKSDYSSVAYWYAEAGATDFFTPMSVAERLPLPPRIEREAQEIETIAEADARRVEDDSLSWGRGVALAGEAGASLPLILSVPQDDRYGIELGLSAGSDAAAVELISNGQRLGDRAMLRANKHRMEARLVRAVPAESPVVLDFIRIAPWRNFVSRWMVIGPFDNKEDKGFDTVYPPETEGVLDQTYRGKDGQEVRWQEARAELSGLVNFEELLPPPHTDAVAYAVATVIAPTERSAEILLGSDDGIKLWVNGKLEYENHAHRAAAVDQDLVRVPLKAGVNTLLVKVDQGGGGWGFYLRFDDPTERLRYGLPVAGQKR